MQINETQARPALSARKVQQAAATQIGNTAYEPIVKPRLKGSGKVSANVTPNANATGIVPTVAASTSDAE